MISEADSLELANKHNRVRATIDTIREYMERLRAWSLIFKRAVDSQMRERDPSKDRAAGPEDSTLEMPEMRGG